MYDNECLSFFIRGVLWRFERYCLLEFENSLMAEWHPHLCGSSFYFIFVTKVL